MKDPVLQEMHAIKDALSARFGHDPGALVADQLKRRNRLQNLPTRRPGAKAKPAPKLTVHLKDAVITEMHAIKDAISARHGHDPRKLGEALIAKQKQHRGRLIQVPTPKISPR